MLIYLYNNLFIMSSVAVVLYLFFKFFNVISMKYFTVSWHYYTYIIIYLFFSIPYHKIISLTDLMLKKQNDNGVTLNDLLPMEIPMYNLSDVIIVDETSLSVSFLPYLLGIGTIVFINNLDLM